MSKKTDQPLPPKRRLTITVPPRVLRCLFDEQHERRMDGDSVSLSGIVLEHLERRYGIQQEAS